MLQITIPAREVAYDEVKNEFCYTKEWMLQLEHSLVSISKWESKWHKPFLDKKEKTAEEIIDYIRCMTITQNVDPEVYNNLTKDNISAIIAYIDDPMTATWFNDDENEKPVRRKILTNELIYYAMCSYNIPVEFQKWHLNRLLTLLRVFAIKNEPPKKMSKSEIMRRNKSLNEARRNALGTRG